MQIISRKEARETGLLFYFTGVPCKRGHVAQRQLSNGSCQECRRALDRGSYWADPEARRAAKREYRATSPEAGRGASKRYREAHPEAARESTKKWREAHPEAARESKKRFRKANPESCYRAAKKWREANPEKKREYGRKYYANNREATAERSARRQRSLEKASYWGREEVLAIRKRCMEITKATGVIHHVDHIVPIKGRQVCGLNVPENLQIITASANLSKGNKFNPLSS